MECYQCNISRNPQSFWNINIGPSGQMLVKMQAGHGMVAETSTTCRQPSQQLSWDTASRTGAPSDELMPAGKMLAQMSLLIDITRVSISSRMRAPVLDCSLRTDANSATAPKAMITEESLPKRSLLSGLLTSVILLKPLD